MTIHGDYKTLFEDDLEIYRGIATSRQDFGRRIDFFLFLHAVQMTKDQLASNENLNFNLNFRFQLTSDSKTKHTSERGLSLCRAACRAYSRLSRMTPVLHTVSLAVSRIRSCRVWTLRVRCYRSSRRAILSRRRALRLIRDLIQSLSSKTCVLKEQKKPPPRRLSAVYLRCRCACPERFLPSC